MGHFPGVIHMGHVDLNVPCGYKGTSSEYVPITRKMSQSPSVEKSEVSVIDLPLTERHVNMSNVLVRAAQGLSLAEKRIMSCCVSKLDSKRLPDLTKPLVARISALEFAETFGIDQTPPMKSFKLRPRASAIVSFGSRSQVERDLVSRK